MMKKIARDHFIAQGENVIIIVNFIFLTILNILRIFASQIDAFFMVRGYLISIAGIVVNVFLAWVLPKLEGRREKLKETKEKGREVDRKNLYIHREKQMSSFYDVLQKTPSRIIFFIGESGAGKSTLLREFRKDNEKNCIFREGDYFESWIKDISETTKKYVILDQFERALQNKTEIVKLKNLKYLRADTKIILSFRRDYLGEIFRIFDFDENICIFHVEFLEDDIRQIREKIGGLAGKSEEEMDRNAFTKAFQEQIISGKLSMISYYFIAQMLQETEFDVVSEKYKKKPQFDVLIREYLAEKLEQLKYPEIGYIVLNILCKDKKGEYVHKIYDFGNLTFAKEEQIAETLGELENLGFINKVKSDKSDHRVGQYEIAHDFLADKLLPVCNAGISVDIAGNIDDYMAYKSIRRQDAGESVNTDLYRNCVADEKKRLLCILLAMLSAVDFFDMLCAGKYGNLGMIFLPLISMFSTYYVYNYFYHFLRPLGKRFYCVVVFGALAVVLLFAFPAYWGVFAGSEIVLLGLFMLFVRTHARKAEKKHFAKDVVVFGSIGGIIIWLGFVFAGLTDSPYVRATYYILYLLYIVMAVVVHIHWKHIVGLLGKCSDYGKVRNV